MNTLCQTTVYVGNYTVDGGTVTVSVSFSNERSKTVTFSDSNPGSGLADVLKVHDRSYAATFTVVSDSEYYRSQRFETSKGGTPALVQSFYRVFAEDAEAEADPLLRARIRATPAERGTLVRLYLLRDRILQMGGSGATALSDKEATAFLAIR